MVIIDEFGKIAEYKNNFKISLFDFFPFGCHFSNKKTGFYLGNSFLGTWKSVYLSLIFSLVASDSRGIRSHVMRQPCGQVHVTKVCQHEST